MTIATYGQLKAALSDWLDRSDMTARIPDFVRLAEATLNKVLRSPRGIAYGSLSVAGGMRYAAAPVDMLEMLFATATDEDYPLEQVSPQQLVNLRQTRLRNPGPPRYFAVVGQRLELAPTPAAATTLDVAYFQKIPALEADGDSNWLLQYDPDVYLYTALLHGAQFLHDDRQAAVYESFLTRQITAAVSASLTMQLAPAQAGPSLSPPLPVMPQ